VKRQYRDIMNTIVSLTPRLLSIFFLILIIYYAFAIVGMECFSFKVSQGCCNDSWYSIDIYYSASAGFSNTSTDVDSSNIYYLNSFNTILSSYGELARRMCPEYIRSCQRWICEMSVTNLHNYMRTFFKDQSKTLFQG
jgi:hypothetical protein